MPRDVSEPHFKEVMAAIPAGFKFLRSQKNRWWREFYFHVDEPIPGFARGDTFVTSVVLKFK